MRLIAALFSVTILLAGCSTTRAARKTPGSTPTIAAPSPEPSKAQAPSRKVPGGRAAPSPDCEGDT